MKTNTAFTGENCLLDADELRFCTYKKQCFEVERLVIMEVKIDQYLDSLTGVG